MTDTTTPAAQQPTVFLLYASHYADRQLVGVYADRDAAARDVLATLLEDGAPDIWSDCPLELEEVPVNR